MWKWKDLIKQKVGLGDGRSCLKVRRRERERESI